MDAFETDLQDLRDAQKFLNQASDIVRDVRDTLGRNDRTRRNPIFRRFSIMNTLFSAEPSACPMR